MNRRDFLVAGAGSTLAFVAPAFHLLPSYRPSSEASHLPSKATDRPVVFKINGWSPQGDAAGDGQVWINVSNSWRSAWR